MAPKSPLRIYLIAVSKEWWQLLSCAGFTILGFWAALTNRSNGWIAISMALLAGVFLICATYAAWLKTYIELQKEIARNLKPDLSVIVREFRIFPDIEYPKPGSPKTVGSTIDFLLDVVNKSFAETNVTRVTVEIKNKGGSRHECEAWAYKLPTTTTQSAEFYGPPAAPHVREAVLRRMITHQFNGSGKYPELMPDDIVKDSVRLVVFDSAGQYEAKIECKIETPFSQVGS